MPILRRFLLALFFGLIFGGVIFFVAPPKSWVEASYFQLVIFFLPYFLLINFLMNIFFNYLPRSFALSLGIFIFTVLQATRQLNYLTGILAFLAALLLFWFIPKTRFRKRVKKPQIPKLTRIRR